MKRFGASIVAIATVLTATSAYADNSFFGGMFANRSGLSEGRSVAVAPSSNPQELTREVPITTRTTVADATEAAPGAITIDTANRYLYLSMAGGQAMRYDVGVGREGFEWSGTAKIARKAEWPGWTPPAAMLKRRPDLPKHMAGGIDNPLGARAMYLYTGKGDTGYRIHGSNEPDTIGQAVSSGCIRMLNADVEDLYIASASARRLPYFAKANVTSVFNAARSFGRRFLLRSTRYRAHHDDRHTNDPRTFACGLLGWRGIVVSCGS